MQRLPYARCDRDSIFELEPGKEIKVEDEEFNFDSPDHATHYGLCGRATNVFAVESDTLSHLARTLPSRNKTDQLVTKLYFPEELHQSEAEILEAEIAAKEPKVKDHVPHMIWPHTFKGTSITKVRKAPEIDNGQEGSCALYII
ncbi:hypothetical protein AZE42_10170, partial [Rhizopogon vesiculosus]